MKQILQNLKTGTTEIIDVPAPAVERGQILIRSSRSLVSTGTERMLIDFGKAGWVEKARTQPEKVKQVLDKIRTDGLLPTAEAIFKKLDEPMPLGYCNAGVVLKVGTGIRDLQPGDRVASNGQHAEMVCVSRNLCSKIPDGVADEEAAFTVLGSIALQGVRLAAPSLGERVMVFGLGLVGLLTVQFLRASGCQVLAVDFSEARLREAEGFGAATVNLGAGADPVAAALAWSGGRGVDGVIIAASAKGDEILHQAASACRKRGRIILVGVADLNLRRSDFYEKEITFQVSCSYGPGRYDEKYEQGGQDYPIGFVRWTEQRNFEAVLEAMRVGQLQVKELITHRIPFSDAPEAYGSILSDADALGVILEYPGQVDPTPTVDIVASESRPAGKCVVSLIGAGNFSKMVLAPTLTKTTASLMYVSARTNGAAAAHIARKYGFDHASTDLDAILADGKVNTVFIATNHNSHASLVCKSLAAGKHVFVEKPLAIDIDGLKQGIDAVRLYPEQHLMVGFNRRFSPHAKKVKALLAGRSEPLAMTMTINAGIIPQNVWVHDPGKGGGRIIGEACHFIDLMVYLAGCKVVSVASMQMGGRIPIREDKMSILLSFEDGSVGTVNYFGNGNKAYPKETLEVYSDGRILKLDNFRSVTGYGFRGFRRFGTWQMDKGHRAEVEAFVDLVVKGGKPLISFPEIVNVTLASFAAVTSAREDRRIELEKEYGELCVQ
jgi:predicted dehydrogenase/threonine dehydrogenase-like Zn-dependent dehydrogenase